MTHHKRPEVTRRLARIEGHIKGIRKMVEEDKPYPDIVQQISAVRAALDGVVVVVIEDLTEDYISQAKDNSKGKTTAIELKDTISRIL
jgi:CsoR family transcriptional regulator, copper-sensing transcriptional repressor